METGAKAEADATQAARQKAVFMVVLLVGVFRITSVPDVTTNCDESGVR